MKPDLASFTPGGGVWKRALAGLVLSLAVSSLCFAGDEVSMKNLPNGAQLIVDATSGNEIVAVVCLLSSGARTELDAECGLTHLTMRTLLRGTRSMSARQLNEAIESLGASVSAGAGDDYSYVSLICLREDLDKMLAILQDVVFNPAFDMDEIEKERETIIASLRRTQDNTFQYTYEEFLKDLYKGHPYARNPHGTTETVADFQQAHLAERHELVCRTDQMLISVAGAVDAAALEKAFSRWPAPKEPAPKRFLATKKFGHRGRIRMIPKDNQQEFIVTGFVTAPVSDSNFPALRVASAVLGEGMSSRLFVVLRDRGSLAYAVGSMNAARFEQGHFACYIGTSPDSFGAALTGISRQIALLRDERAPDEEMERARNFIIGRFHLSQQTNEARARYRASCVLAGLGLDYPERYPGLIRAVTADDVRAVARLYLLSPATVALGPAKEPSQDAARNKPFQ